MKTPAIYRAVPILVYAKIEDGESPRRHHETILRALSAAGFSAFLAEDFADAIVEMDGTRLMSDRITAVCDTTERSEEIPHTVWSTLWLLAIVTLSVLIIAAVATFLAPIVINAKSP